MTNTCSFSVANLIFHLGMVKRVYKPSVIFVKKFTRKPEHIFKIDLLDQSEPKIVMPNKSARGCHK